MRLLLDTHAAIWLLGRDGRASDRAVDCFADETNEVLLSAVVIWEIGVKRALGKLDAPLDMVQQLTAVDVRPLPISLEHAAQVESLPMHHRDPFDRLLVAQAQIEKAVLVSKDDVLREYDIEVLW